LSISVLLLAVAPVALAQEPLRWKFEVGKTLNYNMIQEMNIGTTGGPFGTQDMSMTQEMHLSWSVASVNEDGNAVIRQKFEQMKVKMTSGMGAVEYDSKSETPPTGAAALFAPMYKALTSAEFELIMTPRGEFKDVKVPEELITALKNSPGGAAMGDMTSPDGFKRMIAQGALVLPEKAPQQGEEWTTTLEIDNPVGKQIVDTTYRYEGTKDVEGVNCAVFRPKLKVRFEGNTPVTVKAQESDGEILFNGAEGRLASSQLDQKLSMDQPGGIQVSIAQSVKVKVTPAEEKTETQGETK
jgi:hypothetical protein